MQRFIFLFIFLHLSKTFLFANLIPSIYNVGRTKQITLYKINDKESFDFSQDGTKIVYVMDGNIWLMTSDGTEKEILTQGSSPSFFSQENKIVYENEGEIFVIDLETREQNKLAENGSVPYPFKDGSKVAFISNEEISHNIYIVSSGGTNLFQLSQISEQRQVEYFTISPQGIVAFCTGEIDLNTGDIKSGTEDIYLVDEANFQRKLIEEKEGGAPCFSPDGNKIAFISTKDNNLWLIDLEKNTRKLLFSFAKEGCSLNKNYLPKVCFSKTGDKIITSVYNSKNQKFLVTILNLDGEKIIDFPFPSKIKDVKFSPDGTKIAFLSSKDLKGNLMAIFLIEFIKVILNGEILSSDIFFLQKGGVILVPLKLICDKADVQMEIDEIEKMIKLSHANAYVELKIGKKEAMINGEKVSFEIPPQIIGGRVFVPLRVLAESFDWETQWDKDKLTCVINSKLKEGEN